ncbi:MAG: Smr/MutS family protein [Bacteroidales bacterium]|nr:Smr/MutS family protein [Bacteroidales bacterium]
MTDRRLEAKLGFDRVRAAISNRCQTEYAARRAGDEEFSTDASVISRRLALTDEMRLVLMFEDAFPTTGYIDSLPLLKPLLKEGYSLDALSLAKIGTFLELSRKTSNFFAGIKDGVYPGLKEMSSHLSQFPEIRRRIEGILDKYGSIRDSASDSLESIRRDIRSKETQISKRAAAVLAQAKAEGIAEDDAQVTVRDGKFLLPVNTSEKRKVSGYVYDCSASGKTTFVEPAEVIELENEIMELKFAEAREISRILFEFSEFIRPYVPELIGSSEILGEFDFLIAKAQTALDYVAGMPVISENGEMSLRKARHPLLESALRKEGREMSPLTIGLTPEKRILLISGPNAGGKSVCLKTAGLLQYMMQWGMLVPTSESSELPVFDRIAVSIGDDQSIDNDLSTYSSFLADMRDMLKTADDRTLVLIDEFGAGTDPAAGGAIAEAILAELDRKGAYGVITTHYTNLKLYASNAESHVVNGAMLYDTSKIAPLFKLETGLPGNSFAFELARKMQLPEPIVKAAEKRAGDEFVGMERNLRRIARGRRVLDEKIRKVQHTDKALEGLTEKYLSELEDIQMQRRKILDEARMEAEEIVRNAGRQVEKTIRDIKESQADKEKTRQARAELSGFVAAIEQKKSRQSREREEYIEKKIAKLEKKGRRQPDKTPEQLREEEFRNAPLKVGEKVRVKSNSMVGEVAVVSSRSVTVIIGSVSTRMAPSMVERISNNEYREAVGRERTPQIRMQDGGVGERRLRFHPEIDIRGQRLSEAMDTVMHFIDDAIMLSMPSVRIIHGKGTGVLREEIQKYIRTVPGVASAVDEDIRQGGSGVTIVTFE